MATKYDCHACKKQVTATKNNRYRSHSNGDGEPCEMASEPIPEHVLAHPVGADDAPDVPREGVDYAVCPQCERKVKLTRLGYFEPHNLTLMGGDRCPVSGVRHKHARRTEDVPLPGDEKPKPGAEVPKVKAQEEITSPAPTSTSAPADGTPKELPPSSGAPTEPSSSPESTTTSTDSKNEPSGGAGAPESPSTSSDAEEEDAVAGPFHLAPLLGDGTILQPFSHISQPFPVPPKVRLNEAMSDRGKEIANRLRETFYAYTNRNAKGNRSAQKTLGPSEVGSPCDRQIAMKLMGIPPTNPQEGWAPFVGTAVHRELAEMFEWANGGGAGSGRYVTEMRVQFPSTLVPYGTLDLLDRVLYMIDDHKLMGRYSLNKLIQEGPSETYRIQLQIYGLGATLAGEKVKEVALIAWPRQESSLDKLYVHVEPFDRKVAEAALARVERIAASVQEIRRPDGLGDTPSVMSAAQVFEVGDDCKWCPFHLKNDKNFSRGCPGK